MSTPATPTDLELLSAWREGDEGRGNQLFRRHFGSVHRYFANKVGSERDVEDLIQRTFLACVEARERFAGTAAFRTFLLGIAHNLLCEHYRGAKIRGAVVDFAADSVRDLCAGPSTLLGHKQQEQALLEGLRSIPVESQVLLELYYWEKLTGPELGEFFGVPENTARSRLRKAKLALLEALRTNPPATRSVGGEDDLDAWAEQVRALAFPDEET